MARRMSIHRATTVGPKSPLYQVILKGTSAMKEGENSAMAMTINRSQSLLTTNARLPVLAPPRTERIRLEALLADVWSRDILPLPGISNRSRNEHLVRASSVMRKLSVASLAGPFRKRSGSIGHSIKVPECSAGDPALENDVCSIPEHTSGTRRRFAKAKTDDAVQASEFGFAK
jgi:hypothetical protein